MRSDIKNHLNPLRVGVIYYNSHVIFDRLEFFAPRCKLCELLVCHLFRWPMIRKKFQISVNVQIMCFCYLNHGIYYSTGICSRNRITEQPVLPSNCKWADRILAEIICKAAAPIFQIGLRCIPAVFFFQHLDSGLICHCKAALQQFPADISFANQNHLCTTDRTGLIFFRKRDDYFFRWRSRKAFWSDNPPVPEGLFHDWIFHQ